MHTPVVQTNLSTWLVTLTTEGVDFLNTSMATFSSGVMMDFAIVASGMHAFNAMSEASAKAKAPCGAWVESLALHGLLLGFEAGQAAGSLRGTRKLVGLVRPCR